MYERNRWTRISTPTFETKVVGSSVLGAVVQFSPRNQTWDPFLERPGGAFHLVKNSENSGSGLNGKRFFGSPDRKIPRKSGSTETTFLAVPLFLGIFQPGEPKKRFPFSPEPEFSEFLTKWEAPPVT